MIGISNHWSSSVTKLLMAVTLMLYGHLHTQQPDGLYARHLIWTSLWIEGSLAICRTPNSTIRQLPPSSSYFWTTLGIMVVCISHDKDSLMPFTSH